MHMLKLKIVHIIGNLGLGGAERFVIDLCNEIAKNECYELCIVSLCENQDKNSFVKDIAPNVNYLSFNKKKGFSLAVLIKLTNWLKMYRPNVVHSHLNSSEYLTLYRLFNNQTVFYHTIHNVAEVECTGYFLKNFRRLYYWMNRVIPVTISTNASRTYKEYYNLSNDVLIENGRPPLKITEAYQDIFHQYKSTDNEFLLVHVGRISAEKNQLMLIRAVQAFNAKEDKKCRLLIIGEVHDEKLFGHLKVQADGDDLIEFLGGRSNVADYLSIADGFCLPSIFEGMPITIIESLSLGCIPICTPIGALTLMIEDGVTGFLSENLGVGSYCDAIKRAVYSPDRKIIRQNAIADFQNKYHIEISAKRHLKTYISMFKHAESKEDAAMLLLYPSKFKRNDKVY